MNNAALTVSDERLGELVEELTAGDWTALELAMSEGYVPTVITRSVSGGARPKGIELTKALRERGYKVWNP